MSPEMDMSLKEFIVRYNVKRFDIDNEKHIQANALNGWDLTNLTNLTSSLVASQIDVPMVTLRMRLEDLRNIVQTLKDFRPGKSTAVRQAWNDYIMLKRLYE